MDQAEDGLEESGLCPGNNEYHERGRTRYAIRQLLEAKDLVMETIRALPPARAALVNALVNADKQIMARRGIPTPKPSEAKVKAKAQRKATPTKYPST